MSAPRSGQHEGADTKQGWTLYREGAAPPRPHARPPRGARHWGVFCSGPGAAALRALSRRVLRLPSPAPAPLQRRPRRPRPALVPGGPRGRPPRRPQRAAALRAHLKRGESLMHSSNSTVMAAAACGAQWHEDRGAPSGIPGGPARSAPARPPARPRSAPARPGMRPPRGRPAPPVTAGERRQSPPPARAARCHRRGPSPKSAALARRPLSPPGTVAKRHSLRPRARPAPARPPRRPATPGRETGGSATVELREPSGGPRGARRTRRPRYPTAPVIRP